MALILASPAFANNGVIPKQYSCEGTDISLPLQWSGAPQGTKSFALIIDDPDAPDPRAPKINLVHWVVYNIPADVHGLPGGAAKSGLPPGAKQGLNDWKRAGLRRPLSTDREASILSQALRARRGAAGSRARDESSASGCDEESCDCGDTARRHLRERTLIQGTPCWRVCFSYVLCSTCSLRDRTQAAPPSRPTHAS